MTARAVFQHYLPGCRSDLFQTMSLQCGSPLVDLTCRLVAAASCRCNAMMTLAISRHCDQSFSLCHVFLAVAAVETGALSLGIFGRTSRCSTFGTWNCGCPPFIEPLIAIDRFGSSRARSRLRQPCYYISAREVSMGAPRQAYVWRLGVQESFQSRAQSTLR